MTKIISLSRLYKLRAASHTHNTVVLATGVFDVLHHEHKKFLQAAKKVGDTLIVGLETDARVSKIKGYSRPINNLNIRLKNIASLNIANYVFSLEDSMETQGNREKFISQLRPHILAVSENTPFIDKKQQLMAKFGGQVKIVLPHNPQISTSKILAGKIKQA